MPEMVLIDTMLYNAPIVNTFDIRLARVDLLI